MIFKMKGDVMSDHFLLLDWGWGLIQIQKIILQILGTFRAF